MTKRMTLEILGRALTPDDIVARWVLWNYGQNFRADKLLDDGDGRDVKYAHVSMSLNCDEMEANGIIHRRVDIPRVAMLTYHNVSGAVTGPRRRTLLKEAHRRMKERTEAMGKYLEGGGD